MADATVLSNPDPRLVPALAPVSVDQPARRSIPAGWAGMGIAVLVSLLVVYLHVLFWREAGALWRDEANSVQLATLPTFAETWNYLQFDSFPILFFTLLKGWGLLFSPSNDAAYRTLGLMIGVGVFAAFWLNARLLGCRWPVLSLVLLGCNPLFIRYTGSIRAYGLGIMLLVLTFCAVWRVVESLTARRLLTASLLAILSVQTLYYNSVLLLAICLGGAAAAGYARQWKKVVCVLGIGAPAAASLLVYRETIRRLNEWNFLVHYPADLPWLWKKLGDVTGSPDSVGVWLWTVLVVGACALVAWWLLERRLGAGEKPGFSPAREVDPAAIFAATTLGVGTVGYTLFLLKLQYFTQPWYYITYLALAGVCLDVIFGRAPASPGTRAGRRWSLGLAMFTAVFAALAFFPARAELFVRQTNADLVAARVARDAVRGDLVLHMQWERAITFVRYYHGAAEQAFLPAVTDHRFHRYDQYLQQMTIPDATLPVLARVGEVLRAGHKIWVVGDMVALPAGKRLRHLGPAWKGPSGWHLDGNYYSYWQLQAADYLRWHTVASTRVNLGIKQPVNAYEEVRLGVLSGWKDVPSAGAPPPPTPNAQPPATGESPKGGSVD